MKFTISLPAQLAAIVAFYLIFFSRLVTSLPNPALVPFKRTANLTVISPTKIEPLPNVNINSRSQLEFLPPIDTRMLENDVILSAEQQRSGVGSLSRRWNSNIDFQISTAFSSSEQSTIYSALQQLASLLSNCLTVRLWPQNSTPSGDFVYINNAQGGCFATLGRQGGRQNLNLGQGCLSSGTIIHEMIHSVGFHHEQVRPDRDNYVTINWGNIQPGQSSNFQTSRFFEETFGIPYDYYSIMHYGEYAFSSDRSRRTIQAKRNGIVVGSRGVVTSYDRMKVRAMYKCT